MLHQAMTLRSQHPDGVEQELWVTLLMYNLVRLEMAHIAQQTQIEPCRISLITALRDIIDEWFWSTGRVPPGAIPAKLRNMRQAIRRFLLPPRRSKRRYPRAARMAKTCYPSMKNAAQR